jgi:hypothetical protein
MKSQRDAVRNRRYEYLRSLLEMRGGSLDGIMPLGVSGRHTEGQLLRALELNRRGLLRSPVSQDPNSEANRLAAALASNDYSMRASEAAGLKDDDGNPKAPETYEDAVAWARSFATELGKDVAAGNIPPDVARLVLQQQMRNVPAGVDMLKLYNLGQDIVRQKQKSGGRRGFFILTRPSPLSW